MNQDAIACYDKKKAYEHKKADPQTGSAILLHTIEGDVERSVQIPT